ncbi:bifunctional hydroxymethylpyrimidine kinase/phosphomethylpyrimidine kinase [Clostridium aminobutyricum]|uniref:Hydroxymethylpyrimidine/phosphomethylpyrimidine kinase n=1 Tax=Clostridium aminobutyricum TaxID=33953 RepID=A0A939D9B5_CLOAM|nr:bifunctional hydroxymethylpyrimidine kinase/phosphomethylpyrimidine kinase [Clostridium aminobutyricum]MBN7773103.1 bifunctional hydroxymethylpyrimidine kinase/phosphomethylpyrimidine kinase [Clostridium aminobutyricum]
MKTVLTIAGSDCSGGAGIQADIKTITAHKMYAMSAVTALTAQNTLGVYGVQESTPDFLALQLDCIFSDIRPDAVKIGMVSNGELITVIAEKLVAYQAENIVVDPVMVSTSGSKLLSDDAIDIFTKKLFPLARIITPNIPEAEALCGFCILHQEDMLAAAEKISDGLNPECTRNQADATPKNQARQPGNAAIFIKGGHLKQTADDLLYWKEQGHWFRSERVDNPNTHGTGCSLSSAIACNLAAGCGLEESVKLAKHYIKGALAAGLNLGSGNGPLNHMYNLQICDTIK